MTTPGTAVTAPKARDIILAELTERYSGELAALAPRGVEPAHYIASLRLYLAQNAKVMDCTPASIAMGMLRVAQTGLDLGVSCDLLPFGKTCQFSPRYNGIIELALASGARSLNADVAREGDLFDWEKGTRFFLRHKHTAPAGALITDAYAIAELKPGSFVFEVVPREEIESIRSTYSKQWKSGPLEAIPWYAKKTAVRKLSPYLPKNARFAAALLFADEAERTEDAEIVVEGTAQSEPVEGGERADADGVLL